MKNREEITCQKCNRIIIVPCLRYSATAKRVTCEFCGAQHDVLISWHTLEPVRDVKAFLVEL